MRWILSLLIILLLGCDKNPDVRTLWHNQESIKQLANKNPEAAQKELIEALRYNPFQSEVHLNLGLNLEFLKEESNALKQYATAEKYASHPFHTFIARFNRAQLLARNKKIEEALAEYQRALEIVPTSKEVKTNIELLVQQSSQDQNKDNQNQKDNQDSQDKKDGKNGQDDKKEKDDKDSKDNKDKDKKQDQKKDYAQSKKYQPREFKGELSPADVKKILDELKQQEQKIRAEYNKKNDYKERPRDKDW